MISENTKNLAKNYLNKRKIIVGSCWELDILSDRNGYFRFAIKDRRLYAHRISACIYLGLDYDSKYKLALHKKECNNKRCWNPEHLYIGDYADNLSDTYDLGRVNHNTLKTHCPHGHEYSKENTVIHTGNGNRLCRKCRTYKERQKRKHKLL